MAVYAYEKEKYQKKKQKYISPSLGHSTGL